jgi:hypothetical protein
MYSTAAAEWLKISDGDMLVLYPGRRLARD